MASCYICGSSGANYRREVYTGQSKRINYGRRITFGHSSHYGMRSVCSSCVKGVDWWRNFRVIFWQLVVIAFLIYVRLKG